MVRMVQNRPRVRENVSKGRRDVKGTKRTKVAHHLERPSTPTYNLRKTNMVRHDTGWYQNW